MVSMPAAITLYVNGEARSFGEGSASESLTLAGLLQELGLKADRVAVELNREIVSREQWGGKELHDGDRLEIVHFVGGGAGAGRFCVGARATATGSSE